MRGSAALITFALTLATSTARAACGDGILDALETCDDENTQAADGCTASCQVEAGYVCSGAPSLCCFEDAASAYALLADARIEQGVVTLTPEAMWKEGTAWYRQPLDFGNPFAIAVQLYLGSRDGAPNASLPDLGADGGALLFQRDPRGLLAKGVYTGAAGDGGELGAKSITPVLGVEFDTYANGAGYNDDTVGDEDHTSIFQGATNPPANQLTAATCMNAGTTCANFEDGTWHRFEVRWSGQQDHHLVVAIDGVPRLDLDDDVVAHYFGGDPRGIVFGFAANTGGYYNQQRFCPLAPSGFAVPRDLDADGIDDALDGDTDGDGASDSVESSGVFGGAEPDADHDGDGVQNYRDVEYWVDMLGRASECPDQVAPIGACDSFVTALDFDRDGVSDHVDLDADADGTPDANDAAPRDACVPAVSAACVLGAMDAGVGVVDASTGTARDASLPPPAPTPGDRDGDGVANEVDPAPSDPCIPNRNALACGSGDADGDHLSNEFECPGLRTCRDSDGDGVSDYADPDSDGDGISDAKECVDMNTCADSDGDGIPDLLSPAATKSGEGCALGSPPSLTSLWLVLGLLLARTSWCARCATALACGARRSLPWSRAARLRRPATPRSS